MSDAAAIPTFVHLRVHTEFSVSDGIVRIPDLLARVAEFEQPAVAISDLANVFGLIRFYKAARARGIKPIAGCDIWVTNDADREQPYRLLLLVRDHKGYLNLCELLTRAYQTN